MPLLKQAFKAVLSSAAKAKKDKEEKLGKIYDDAENRHRNKYDENIRKADKHRKFKKLTLDHFRFKTMRRVARHNWFKKSMKRPFKLK